MLSVTKFRGELARFSVKGSARRQHIERWSDDDRADGIWENLKAAAPDLDAQGFIRFVLKERQDALSLVAALDHTQAERDYWLPIYADDLGHTCRLMLSGDKSPAQIAWHLENVAASLRQIENPFSIPDDVEFSRQDVDGSRARKLFVQKLGRYFHSLCGQWRDWEVAVLTEIAFPGQEITEDQIRRLRRS